MTESKSTHYHEVLLDFYFKETWAEKHEHTFQGVLKKISDRVTADHAVWKQNQQATSDRIAAAEVHLQALKDLGCAVEVADLRKDLIDVVLPPDALLAWVHEWKARLKKAYMECPTWSNLPVDDTGFPIGQRPNYLRDADAILKSLRDFRLTVVQERRNTLADFSRLSKMSGIYTAVLQELGKAQRQLRDASLPVLTTHVPLTPPDLSDRYLALQTGHAQLQLSHANLSAESTTCAQQLLHVQAQNTALWVRIAALEQLLAKKVSTPTLCIGVERLHENASIEETFSWLASSVGTISFEQTQAIKQATIDFLRRFMDDAITMQTSSSQERTNSQKALWSGTTGTAVLAPVVNQLKWRINRTQTLPELLTLLRNIPALEIMCELSERNSAGKVSSTVQNLNGSCYQVARQKGYFWAGKDNSLHGTILQFIDMFEKETFAGLSPTRLADALKKNLDPRLTVLTRRIRGIIHS